ncbi:MAG: isoprenylcysteine carboxylmethyltransferase family protein [Anaerolineales bacterium]
MSSMVTPELRKPGPIRKFSQLLIQLLFILAVLGGLLFIPAGRLGWMDAWAYIIAYGVFLLSYAIWGSLKDPEQLAERSQSWNTKNAKPWDKVILLLYTVGLLALFIVCGLDAGRFHWSRIPAPAKGVAWFGLVCSTAIIFWTLETNTYLSRVARIQADRGQVVITSGPYGHVRHPMYIGIIILFLCSPVALGSAWGLVPAGIIGILFIIRTAKEDRMLQEELAGYKDYSKKVRYRLVPGIW